MLSFLANCIPECPTFTLKRHARTEAVSPADVLIYTVDLDECVRACYDHTLCTAVAVDKWNYTCQLYWNIPFSNLSTVQNSGDKVFEVTCLGKFYVYSPYFSASNENI